MKLISDKEDFQKIINTNLKEFNWYNSPYSYPWYERWWDTIKEIFDFKKYWQKIRFFYQRHTRGWDDSETWDMDYTFYRWIYSRLNRYKELTNGYPDEYEEYEDWIKELEKRIEQIRRIIEIDEFDFPYHEYLTQETIDDIAKRFGEEIPSQTTYNMAAKSDCEKDFMEWFKNNLKNLWW